MSIKITYSKEKIVNILNLHQNGFSCEKISKLYGISKTPINRILKERGVLRKGFSNGRKIELTEQQKEKIKNLYVNDKKTAPQISKILGLNEHFIKKQIYNSDYKRTAGESISLRQKGKKHTKERIKKHTIIQQKLAASGKRKQRGGVCRFYEISGLECQGTYEKFYIEKLIKEKKELPKKGISIKTPYGVYNSDFSNNDSLIEIKSNYTYDVLIGKKINRFTKKIDLKQYKKIKWVNRNIKPVNIIVIDKRNNSLIKKEIK